MSYQIVNNEVYLPCKNGVTLRLSITANSGRIVYRDKVDTVLGVPHPGIELGTDQYGRRWFAHHHYLNQYPTIDCEEVYADGNIIFYDNRTTAFNQSEILKRTLASWWDGKQYKLANQNCQHFVNEIAFNQHRSDSLDKAADAVVFLAIIAIIAGAFTKNKSLLAMGLGMVTLGGATKLMSRIQPNSSLSPISLEF